ncbi:MAG: hypothetical protein QOE90_2989 [Thermoplasmata archaeon]|jgi:hypothetical protein|nr:hypothetical protein [Thermoplasmata archaeon]
MSAKPSQPEAPEFILKLETKEVEMAMLPGPGVYAFGAVRPMGRIRAYTSAGLTPFAGRGAPSEFLLLGHVHVDANGLVSKVEGFNGQEGEAWAKAAKDKLAAENKLAPGAVVQPMAPLRGCAYTGIR